MPELERLVQALLDPTLYPDSPREVEMVQTQMSVLFMTGHYVYKIKKPVDLGYLDYTTLEKRRRFCHQEVDLNRRLSPDVYLEVTPIVEQNGRLAFGAEGDIVEYAVKMRQLPADRMMDVLLSRNQVSEGMIRQVARKVAGFHRAAETNDDISSYGGLDIIRTNTGENFAQMAPYIGAAFSRRDYDAIQDYTNAFAEANASLFRKRISDGRIRDCHGDLHSAHICFANGISIYDCIEFNYRFRYCDVAAEVAFLAMDLDFHGQPALSHAFVGAYVEESGDHELLRLLDFYKSYFACVRGKVSCFKYDDRLVPEDERKKSLATAGRYFELATSYSRGRPGASD